MKILKWIFIVLLSLAVILLIVAAFLPSKVNVSASVEINQPPAKIFHSLATFSDRQSWDPWASMDSTTKVTIVPNPDYVGSTYEWEGEKIGTGKMRVDSVEYAEHISSLIWFGDRPDPAEVSWDFEDIGNGKTNVTWGFQEDAAYPLGRLFLNLMKGRLESDFRKGVENLKAYLDPKEINLSSLSEITEVEVPEIIAMVVRKSGKMEEITQTFEEMFTQVMTTIQEQGLQVSGAPFCYYTEYSPEDMTTTAYCGFPVVEAGKPTETVIPIKFPARKAIKATHTGPYEELAVSYEKLMDYSSKNNVPVTWNAWEVYLDDPSTVKYPTHIRTEIYFEIE